MVIERNETENVLDDEECDNDGENKKEKASAKSLSESSSVAGKSSSGIESASKQGESQLDQNLSPNALKIQT